MSTSFLLVLALCLDAALGEPRWLWSRLPHPAVLMGRLIGWADRNWNQGANQREKGAAVVVALVVGMAVLGAVLSALGWVVTVVVATILLAQRSLVDHVQAVADALRLSTGDGRLMVARIVSRDTSDMDQSAVSRSAIESAAENLSDGVVAPAFWFLVAGLPGLLIYKAINTADSMIGYRTDRYEEFGKAAARLDDLLNFIPARLTAIMIAVGWGLLGEWSAIRLDARQHRSPNAGWPEAAMSRAIGVALSGPRSYDGALREFPFVNPEGKRILGATDIDAAIRVLWAIWGGLLVIALILTLL
ncbi:adenosylcobinamide-phosphate synthase CbiB [Shimia biformata]|uniref:adenosylcobinamide-phosphate synthase CbiB n=1 Tax=Shimia biformata TaxID=1294299 RepID=UPI0019521F30